MTKRQAVFVRLVAVCFPIAMLVAAMLDLDRNPTGLDAPFPHYWLYHGMAPIPIFFNAVGLVGLVFVWSWMDRWKFFILCAYALVVTTALAILLLDAFFVTHNDWFNG